MKIPWIHHPARARGRPGGTYGIRAAKAVARAALLASAAALQAPWQAGSLQSTKPLQLSSIPLKQISGWLARDALSKGVVMKARLLRRLDSPVLVVVCAMFSRVSSQLNAPNGGVVTCMPTV